MTTPENAVSNAPANSGLPPGKMPQLRVMPAPSDANVYGDVFGGWIMAQVDIAGSLPATRRANGRVATIAVNSFLFKHPVFVGDLLSFYADIVKVGNTSITVYVEVYAERNRLQADTVKVTEATLTYVATGADRKPRQLPPLESLISNPGRLMDRQRRIFLLNAAQLAALAAAGLPGLASARANGAVSVQPRRRLRFAAARLGHPVDAHPGRSAERRRDRAGRRQRALGGGRGRGLPPHRCQGRSDRPARAGAQRARRRHGPGAGPLVLVPLHAGRRGQPDRAHAHRAGAGRLPAMLKLAVASCQHWEFGSYAAHRQIAAAAPDLVAFLGDYIYEWGPYQLKHPAQIDAQQRVVHAGRLPRPLCAVQERSRPAGRAPGGAMDRDLGRPRGGERLRQRPRPAQLDPISRRAARPPTRRSTSTCRCAWRRPGGAIMQSCAYTSATTGAGWRASMCSTTASTAPPRLHAAERGGSGSVRRRDCADLRDPARTMLGGEQEAWLASGLGFIGARAGTSSRSRR